MENLVQTLEDTEKNGAPIYFLFPDGNLSNVLTDKATTPVVRISIRPAFLDNPKTSDPAIESITALALIDTGADNVYIDEEFAERHGFLSNKTISVYGATGHSEQKTHPALFRLCDDARHHTQSATFISVPLRKNGRNYDVIMGIQLLSNGVLIMDFDSNTFRFEFTTEPKQA